MNWRAVAVVTGLSTLFLIIQFVANQRQQDFHSDSPPPVRPVNQPSTFVGSASSCEDAVRSSSPSGRRRGIDFDIDVRSPDDDCSSYLLNRPCQQPAAAPSADDSRNLNNAASGTQPPQQDDRTYRKQPMATTQTTITDYCSLGGARATHSNSDCGGGGGAQKLNGVGQRTHRGRSCLNLEEGTSTHSVESGEEAQSPATAMQRRGTGRRSLADVIEIITTPCDVTSPAGTPEAAGGDYVGDDDVERRGRQCSSQPGSRVRSWMAMYRWVDYVVSLVVLLFSVLSFVYWVFTGERL